VLFKSLDVFKYFRSLLFNLYWIFWYFMSLRVLYLKPINMATSCKPNQIGMNKSWVFLKAWCLGFLFYPPLFSFPYCTLKPSLWSKTLVFLIFLQCLAHHNHLLTCSYFVLHQNQYKWIQFFLASWDE
jgi:hypothetical protein